jgi:hypothetical protein
MNNHYTILIIVVLLIIFYLQWENIKVNIIVFLTLKRGIISQNCFWWKVNDYFPDSTGLEIYLKLKNQGRFIKLNVLGKQIYLLTKIEDISQLLELSPNPFGPGILKKNFFNSFMPKNVGISINPEWKYRREYNDKVLETDQSHQYNLIFNEYINEIYTNLKPKNFEKATELTRRLTSRIIFGTYEYNPIIYKVFTQADTIISATYGINTINQVDLKEYQDYLRFQLENPKPNTLLFLGHKYHRMLPIEDVIQQIPHWIFPIAGLFSVHLPRLLVILANQPEELEKVKSEIIERKYLIRENYIRKCILELFRLNNAVNSTFRGLLEDFQFNHSKEIFPKNTEFVFFNNPVLRDLFENPNLFIPSRWNLDLEDSFKSLMFNQGNQKCPGKELVISLLTMGLITFLKLTNFSYSTNIKLNPLFIPYLINPCTITFNF